MAISQVIFIKNEDLNETSDSLFLANKPLKFGTIAVAIAEHITTGKEINVLTIPLLIPYKFVACKLEKPAFDINKEKSENPFSNIDLTYNEPNLLMNSYMLTNAIL